MAKLSPWELYCEAPPSYVIIIVATLTPANYRHHNDYHRYIFGYLQIDFQEALEEENEANHGRPAFCALLPERGPCVMLTTRLS